MNSLKNFENFLNEKQYTQGKPNAEANIPEFYEKAKLKEDQKKSIASLVEKTANEGNVKKQEKMKALILAKLAGLEEKEVLEMEKELENEDFMSLLLLKLSGLSMEQGKAFQEL